MLMAAAGDQRRAAVAARWITPDQNPEWFTPASAAAATSVSAMPSQSFASDPASDRTMPSADVFGVGAQPKEPLQPPAVMTHPTNDFQFAASDFVSPGAQGYGICDDLQAAQPPTPAVPDRAGQLISSPTAPVGDEDASEDFQDILAILTA